MSFDLYFCWRKPERINFEEVTAWSEGVECFKRSDAQLWYSNPKTGVYFSFDSRQRPQSPQTMALISRMAILIPVCRSI
jgi:hypothetical protein